MLNPKTNERELAYVARVDQVKPIAGKDRVECAVVGGWTCMVPKGAFQAGDLGIYFEIDSKVPTDKEPFAFCEKYHGNIKTQKFKTPDGQFWSQGLLMPASDFGGICYQDGDGTMYLHFEKESFFQENKDYGEGEFLTAKLGVTYAVAEDNKRKGSGPDKYKRMAARHPQLFQKPFIKWLYKKSWGKKVLFLFFGKKKDKRSWPAWVVKTDEERVQNMPWILEDKNPWFATEKIDGTSTTFTMKGRGRKKEFYICSRNVCFDTPEKMEKGAFYDTNVYQEMAIKYDVEKVLEELLNNHVALDFVTLQGETYGKSIQKREYGLDGHDFMAFNLIFGYPDGSTRRCNPKEMTDILTTFGIPCVPIVNENFILPDTVEELLTIATDKSAVDGGMREGLVFRSADGAQSFKAVSNEFLLKYHNG